MTIERIIVEQTILTTSSSSPIGQNEAMGLSLLLQMPKLANRAIQDMSENCDWWLGSNNQVPHWMLSF